jgi:lipooligosaccharide transport system permease protein
MAGILQVVEHRALQYRRTVRASLFGSFVSPVMFLAAMGLGLGGYVDRSGTASLGTGSYLQFLAPGLLAPTVMQAAAFESTYPIIGGFLWNRIFLGMAASPITPRAVALGTLAWIAIRMTMIAIIFTVVLVLFGAASSPLVVLAIPVAVLTGMAFAGFIGAYAAGLSTPDNFNAVFRFAIMPLFLLSGTFFPLTGLPAVIQAVAWVSPLWHGVSLARALALGTAPSDPLGTAAHLAVLVAVAAAGGLLMVRMVRRRLEA